MADKEGMRLSDLNESKIYQLLDDKDDAHSKRRVENSVKIFNSFLKSKNLDPSLMYDRMRLHVILRSFYSSILTANGEYFKRKTLNGIRHGLAKPLKANGIAIIDDPVFTTSRKVFRAVHSGNSVF